MESADSQDKTIDTIAIRGLQGKKFFIPSYQRGYRWTEQQVTDLLNDIDESKDNWYCLQPLVVKKIEENDPTIAHQNDKGNDFLNKNENIDYHHMSEAYQKIKEWFEVKFGNGHSASTTNEEEKKIEENDKGNWYEVIDGQQRLTTIFIILKYLDEKLFEIEYETRKKSSKFLNTLDGNDGKNEKWVKEKKAFKTKLLDKVKFIWYEPQDEDPIKVFRRLNVGKIPLTNAELIKALFLNKSNFPEQPEQLRQQQMEIAMEWDQIEYTLQNDEFWLFLHQNGDVRPTRIDFIFDLIVDKNPWEINKSTIGTDNYQTFRYFYEYFNKKNREDKIASVRICWSEIKKYFQIFQEWFNDLRMYHYVGFLVEQNVGLKVIIKDWKGDKGKFIENLKDKIKDKIKKHADLSEIYEVEYQDKDGKPKKGVAKTYCKPILLLHNIQTVINQNTQFQSKEEYKLPVFYKFPFHLFKKETWNVEHINSNTTNGLEEEREQKEWLKHSSLKADLTDATKNKIKMFLSGQEGRPSFEELSNEIETPDDGEWNATDKNKIWNFVLLDEGTNKGYGNAIFPAKRRCIIGKDQGKKYIINNNLEISEDKGAIAFVPPVTKNVFLKYYNTSVDNLQKWTKSDAEAYRKNILETLQEFGVTDSSNN